MFAFSLQVFFVAMDTFVWFDGDYCGRHFQTSLYKFSGELIKEVFLPSGFKTAGSVEGIHMCACTEALEQSHIGIVGKEVVMKNKVIWEGRHCYGMDEALMK